MDNRNVRVTVIMDDKYKQGTYGFNEELKRKVQKHLSQMQRVYNEAEFIRQVKDINLLTLTMAGVDFMLYAS